MQFRAVDGVYFGLQLFALATLPVLTLTFILKKSGSSRVNPILPANTILYSVSALTSCLLLFTNHLDGPTPPPILCQAQSAFILAIPPGLSALAFSLVFCVFRIAWHVHRERVPWLSDTQTNIVLIVFPYLLFVAVLISSALVGAHNPVTRRQFYCLVENDVISVVSASISAILLLTTCVFQVWTVFIVWRRYRISRKLGREEIGDIDVTLFVRVISFGIFVFVAFVLSIVGVCNYTLLVPDILVACFGPAIFLIFASQDDILRTWRLKSPLPRTPERNASVVTIHSARRQPTAYRPSTSVGSEMDDLHSYRFPDPS